MRPDPVWKRAALLVALSLCLAGTLAGQDKKVSASVESDVDFGVKMAQRGLWKEALFRFQQADEQQPNDSRLLNNIAVAYEAVGAYDKALETYKRALQANAADRELKQNYSRFLEFYQAYKPEQPSEADQKAQSAAVESEAEEAADEGESADEAPETTSDEAAADSAAEPDSQSRASFGVTPDPQSPSSTGGQ